MTEIQPSPRDESDVDVAEFCRQVEEHLARVNDGHLIRIVGPGFELVRSWALTGIPLSVVCHGISLKAERHNMGRSKRPLRLEFCEMDVRAVYGDWRRAVGLSEPRPIADADSPEPAAERRRPSLTRHLERVIDRIARVTGRLDLPEQFRDTVHELLDELARLRETASGSRGAARADFSARLAAIDDALLAAARRAVGPDELGQFRIEAATELAAYRTRLTPEAWQRSLDLSADRLLRGRLGLPTVKLEG